MDEETLAAHLSPAQRKLRGVFFTPRPLVLNVLEEAARVLPRRGPAVVVDPACGAGAFLSAAAERFPRARLVGCELNATSAKRCRARVPGAEVLRADALKDDALLKRLGAPAGFELWLGNPPYNGTSPLLKSKALWQRVLSWLPPGTTLPRGTSLREDYLFFLLLAARRLSQTRGAVAFVTSATLLDAFAYAPVREALLKQLTLKTVVPLGRGAFKGTQVSTCVTVWMSGPHESAPFTFVESGRQKLPVSAPAFRFRPEPADVRELDAAWRVSGEPLTTLVPVHFPGLKTRFDELLVDDDAGRLLARVRELLATPASRLEAFAARHELPERTFAKLRALHAATRGVKASRAAVRRFHRYRGALPPGPPAYCYLDRCFIPRGDHRLQGAYDPHLEPVKLVFNVHELPLAARVLDEAGCVTAYRHARFAPLLVPRAVRGAALAGGRLRPDVEPGPMVPNLSPRGLELAERLGTPRAVFDAIARFVRSELVQAGWAPTWGTSRVLPVPLDGTLAELAERIAG